MSENDWLWIYIIQNVKIYTKWVNIPLHLSILMKLVSLKDPLSTQFTGADVAHIPAPRIADVH